MPLASVWLWFFCLPVLQVQGFVTAPSYVSALPSVEHLPELQPVLSYRAAFAGEGQRRVHSAAYVSPLSPQAAQGTCGHHLQSAELSPSALLLCYEEGDERGKIMAAAASA